MYRWEVIVVLKEMPGVPKTLGFIQTGNKKINIKCYGNLASHVEILLSDLECDFMPVAIFGIDRKTVLPAVVKIWDGLYLHTALDKDSGNNKPMFLLSLRTELCPVWSVSVSF